MSISNEGQLVASIVYSITKLRVERVPYTVAQNQLAAGFFHFNAVARTESYLHVRPTTSIPHPTSHPHSPSPS